MTDFEFNLDDKYHESVLEEINKRKITPGYDEFLPETKFDPTDSYPYTVAVGTDGVTVYSECCGDVMEHSTIVLLHNAISAYLESTEWAADK